jgi:hypothetical protein
MVIFIPFGKFCLHICGVSHCTTRSMSSVVYNQIYSYVIMYFFIWYMYTYAYGCILLRDINLRLDGHYIFNVFPTIILLRTLDIVFSSLLFLLIRYNIVVHTNNGVLLCYGSSWRCALRHDLMCNRYKWFLRYTVTAVFVNIFIYIPTLMSDCTVNHMIGSKFNNLHSINQKTYVIMTSCI